VTGTASGTSLRTVRLNNVPISISSGSFSSSVTLTEGENTITLAALDSAGNVVGTHTVFVTLDSQPPVVVISEPSNAQVISRPDIVVKGTINDPSILSININEVPVNAVNGNFSAVVSLRKGLNKILALVSDKAGNLGRDSVTVNCTSLVGVDETAQTSLPLVYNLSQNYPNPFNPSTTIQYQLPEKSHVILEIYSILGQRIRVLVDQNQAVGYYTVNWNGTDEHGKNVASGVYICRLKTAQFVNSEKMVILR
jgi:hypothetical protein